MFAAGFAESGISDLNDAYPSTRSTSTSFYEYEPDSDLEDEGEDEQMAGNAPGDSIGRLAYGDPFSIKLPESDQSEVRLPCCYPTLQVIVARLC